MNPKKPKIILLNKPFQVLCQFSDHENKTTLSKFVDIPNVYAAGRLDYDSEGLLVLTDNGSLQSLITHPENKLHKTYWAQVEGDISELALSTLTKGVSLKDGVTKPAIATKIEEPPCWQRVPPIRERANIPTSWIELTIREGKNRQVRRMTAAVGFPTLRLIRKSIGPWDISNIKPGSWCEAQLPAELEKRLSALQKEKATPKQHKRRSHPSSSRKTNNSNQSNRPANQTANRKKQR